MKITSTELQRQYKLSLCPDCDIPIPDDAEPGESCECGHVFVLSAPSNDLTEEERTGVIEWKIQEVVDKLRYVQRGDFSKFDILEECIKKLFDAFPNLN